MENPGLRKSIRKPKRRSWRKFSARLRERGSRSSSGSGVLAGQRMGDPPVFLLPGKARVHNRQDNNLDSGLSFRKSRNKGNLRPVRNTQRPKGENNSRDSLKSGASPGMHSRRVWPYRLTVDRVTWDKMDRRSARNRPYRCHAGRSGADFQWPVYISPAAKPGRRYGRDHADSDGCFWTVANGSPRCNRAGVAENLRPEPGLDL